MKTDSEAWGRGFESRAAHQFQKIRYVYSQEVCDQHKCNFWSRTYVVVTLCDVDLAIIKFVEFLKVFGPSSHIP